MTFNKYDLIVFDVDGTLYFQNKLRMIMAGRLVGYYALRPWKFKDLLIIKEFRSLRDKAENTDDLYEITAEKCKVSVDRVKAVIRKWIYENPMDAVAESQDRELIEILESLKITGKQIAIWSDYEADDKLKALGILCDLVYTAEQDRVKELKPSPKGLKLIMMDTGTPANKTLMVGDRMVKDGEAAKAAGCDYVILSKNKRVRHAQLMSMK